jgi:hypothetical protein
LVKGERIMVLSLESLVVYRASGDAGAGLPGDALLLSQEKKFVLCPVPANACSTGPVAAVSFLKTGNAELALLALLAPWTPSGKSCSKRIVEEELWIKLVTKRGPALPAGTHVKFVIPSSMLWLQRTSELSAVESFF